MRHFFLILIFFFNFPLWASTENSAISTKEAVILGITQGATEFVPVSSTAHTLLVEKMLSRTNSISQQNNKARKAFAVIVQLGTLLSACLIFRRKIALVIREIYKKNSPGQNLAKQLLAAFIPTGFAGFFLNKMISEKFYRPLPIAAALVVGAIVMLVAEFIHRLIKVKKSRISLWNAIQIGFWQCLALIPGVSRSMVTITGGYLGKLDRKTAIEFSFLLGIITSFAATVYELFSDYASLHLIANTSIFWGIFTSFVTSIICISLCFHFLIKQGMTYFAFYRIALAVTILFYLS